MVPTTVIAFTQPIQMRVEELSSSVCATLAAKLGVEALGELDRLSQKIKDIVTKVCQGSPIFHSKRTWGSHKYVSRSTDGS